MKRAIAPAAVIVAAIIGACTQIGSDPNAVVALAFDSLPYPAIVAGDTLRDESGAVLHLRAAALNSDGHDIPSAAVSFLMLDTGATISADGIVTSTYLAATSLRILAQAGNLQSRPLTLVVTPRPDSIARDGTVDTLRYLIPDVTANTSPPITIKALSNSATPASAVRGWIVRYSIEYHGATVSPADGTLAWLVDDNNRRSTEDTTATDGRASRRLRVNSTAILSTDEFHGRDSIVVIATAFARGGALAGSPVRTVVQLRANALP